MQEVQFSPEWWAAIHAAMVGITLWSVAGLRKIFKSVDGPLPVIVVGTIVGIAVSFLLGAVTKQPLDWTRIPIGAGYAAAAFGYASWRKWVAAANLGNPTSPPVKDPDQLVAMSTAPVDLRREGGPIVCTGCGEKFLNTLGDYCAVCGTKFGRRATIQSDHKAVKRGGAAALICLAVLSTGCPAISKILPTVMNVISTVQDATLIVEQIVDWADEHFTASPDPDREAQVKQAIQEVRSALLVANRTAQAGHSDKEALDAFRTAYDRLVGVLGGLPGVKLEHRDMMTADGPVDDGFELVSEKTGLRLSVPSIGAAK